MRLLDLWREIEEEEIADEDQHCDELQNLALLVAGAEENRAARHSRRHHLYLTRDDLLPDPRGDTPWQRVLKGRNDRAFITLMGFDVPTFHHILDSGFWRCWDQFAIPRSDTNIHGKPRPGARSLDAEGALGLALHYLSSTMREITLAQIFALTPSTISRYIRFSLAILLQALRTMPSAAMNWPAENEFPELSELITARHPRLAGAFGFIDGLNLPVEVSEDPDIANAYYNGWLKAHVVSSVLVFSPEGISHNYSHGTELILFRSYHWMLNKLPR
jgi:hypothetical protein